METAMSLKKRNFKPPISWPFLPTPQNGMLTWPDLDQSIKDSIRIILLTRQKELLMRPRFGAGISGFLHQPNTLSTRKRIKDRIERNLEQWEPRIKTERVDVWAHPEKNEELRIEIAYRINTTGRSKTLAINMNLGE